MNQCLSCNKPGIAAAVFCDACRAALLHQYGLRDKAAQSFPAPVANADVIEGIHAFQPPSHLQSLPLSVTNTQFESCSQLDKALPSTPEQDNNLGHLPADAWPEFGNPDMGEGGGDMFADQADPLPPAVRAPLRRVVPKYLRVACITLAFLALLLLALDGIFFASSVTHPHSEVPRLKDEPRLTPPIVTVTPGMAYPGQASSTVGVTPASTSTPAPGISPPGGSMMDVSPSSLTFSVTQGQANPPGHEVTIANTGSALLNWQAGMNATGSSWLSFAPTKGTVAAGSFGQMVVNINANGLVPGTYGAQITMSATNDSGAQLQNGPQVITVNLVVLQPCSLQVAPSSLSFTATLLQL